jgi:low-density lipoprotein receptor-related protein 4
MSNFLIFSRRTDLRTISLDVGYFADVVIPVGELQNVVAVGVDVIEGKVYWSDIVLDRISRANLNGTNVEDVIVDSLDTADGLAIDYIERHIYWTDAGKDRIEVAQLDGELRKILIWQNLDSPRAIALQLTEGYIFWTDWGREPRIERADMDGGNRKILIQDNLGWPNGLAIDEATSRIIWVDAKTEVIECANLNGKQRRVLLTSVPHPYGLTVAGSKIYWTDWQTQSVMSADKDTGNSPSVIRDKLMGIMNIHAVGVQQQISVTKRRCGDDNGGCSHLCLPNPTGHI